MALANASADVLPGHREATQGGATRTLFSAQLFPSRLQTTDEQPDFPGRVSISRAGHLIEKGITYE
jgi:hypothetical protein